MHKILSGIFADIKNGGKEDVYDEECPQTVVASTTSVCDFV